MRNCFVLHIPDKIERWPAIGIADLTNLGEMVPGTRTITRINIPAPYRGQGYGSQLLKEILAEADAEGVKLSLEILPSGALDYDELESWYMRYGFNRSFYPGIYIRHPRPQAPAN